jgi:uncharacterized protein (DUF302 family)
MPASLREILSPARAPERYDASQRPVFQMNGGEEGKKWSSAKLQKEVRRMINYGFRKELEAPFEPVVEQVTARLKEQGFGVLTTIDVREKFREKLGIDFRKYVILGACRPASAHQALLAEEDIGLLLPCNVIVYEKDGKTVVAIIKPTVAMQTIDNRALRQLAETIEAELRSVMDAIA